MKNKTYTSLFLLIFLIITSCNLYKKDVSKDIPQNALERAKKNVKEGRGISIGGMLSNKGTNYEFGTSNPMWRASLEVLDFMPLSTVDYAGGVIISEWYNSGYNNNESIKISLQFLSNEIRPDSLKIKVFKKICKQEYSCQTIESNSKIKEEMLNTILKNAAELEIKNKSKK